MTNAEKIRSLSDAELAETYINVLTLNYPTSAIEAYQSKHTKQIFYTKEGAIENEFEWLQKDVPKITNAEKIRSMSDEELADFLSELSSHCYECGDFNGCGCHYGNEECGDFGEWLKSEVEE